MLKAIIFDLNGVFIKSPKLSDRVESDFEISSEIFMPALKDVMAEVRMPGARDFFEYWKPYFEKWNLNFTREEFLKYWFEAEILDNKMVAYAKELKAKNIKIFILSNNLRERSLYYDEHFKVLNELFNKMYFSWQTGFIKPDPKAYEKLLADNNLEPEECLYFDDSPKNIAIAESLGIKSYLFKGFKETERLISIVLKKSI
jgi:putative hydrolase of the HAD superfamily